ncbi:MAG: hypothetical protein A2287_06405 [Candidatus Melainabacteria bacterium RIFOXYA12_FULL_32_12]|nr:MAG: hypothetical protein A2255_06885 [Candidatus Melainabacteria bacterium RIFOXYA2_FULL_32_9]OGI31580.1 MAG: hypothetical protein A2287_06405 [Candidatus Melainabacteria bacterium RIFOXYA12_FULL_32_12]
MYGRFIEEKIRLLIVEDDKLFRTTLSVSLQENPNIDVIGEAENGEQAVKLAKELNPDMILMDLGLPEISGIEATEKILAANPNIKIIVLTSHSNEDEAMDALNAGAVSYARKDIKFEHLTMIIQTVHRGAVWIDPIIAYKVLRKSKDNSKK